MHLLFVGYATVFVAELVGDKSIYTICLLAGRYRRAPVAGGVLLAFMGKMWVAVFVGGLLSALPAPWVSAVSALTFVVMAVVLWFKGSDEESEARAYFRSWPYAGWVAFAAIFFTEWGDPGQLAAMALAAHYHARLTIWLAATMAMATKAALAMVLGHSLLRRFPQAAFRCAAVCIFLTMGGLSAIRVLR